MGAIRQGHWGFTLGEVMVSLGLLTLMLVSTLVLFSKLLATTTKNGYLETASIYADQVLEHAGLHPAPSSPAYPAVATGEQSLMVEGASAPTKFLYRLDATQVADPNPHGERWLLQVEVSWWKDQIDGKQAARSDYGLLRTRQSRLVYVKW